MKRTGGNAEVRADWQKLPFDKVVADESGGNLKTPQSAFLKEGEFAIVDQGKELISGYVNDRTRLCHADLPVVVFGDHTRCFKFVDFPFCMGADGVKVLRPKVKADVKYLYHFLRQVRLYDGGYDRHFKYLKRADVLLPPLAEQRRIAEVLDQAETLRAKRHAALNRLNSLSQSLFLDLFGDTRKEHTRWPTVPLEAIARETKLGLVRGSQEFGPDFPIPYVRMNAITRNGELELEGVQRTNATKAEIEAYGLESGDFLFNTRNSEELVGKTALYRGGELHLFNNNIMRIRFTADADPEFVAAAFKTPYAQHELDLRKSGTTNVFAIYYKDLRTLPLPLPPIKLQRTFARRVHALEKLKTIHRASLAELDALFATLQHRAFRGEL